LFSARDVQRINHPERQNLGFSLSDIKEFLILQQGDGEGCCHVRDLLRTKLGSVRAKASLAPWRNNWQKLTEVRTEAESGRGFAPRLLPGARENRPPSFE